MLHRFMIEVETERTEGKFVSREEIEEELRNEIENSDPGNISVEDSEYEVASWDVSDLPDDPKPIAIKKDINEILDELWGLENALQYKTLMKMLSDKGYKIARKY